MKINITEKALKKLRYYVDDCDTEISGLGKVHMTENGFEIYDIELLQQTVTMINSSIGAEDLAKFMFDKINAGESIKDYKVWWHSHVNMESYFSGLDEQTIEQSTEYPFLISIVSNKRNEDKVRLDIYDPIRLTLTVELNVILEEDKVLKEKCQQEIQEKVKTNFLTSILKGKKKYSTHNLTKKQ